LRVIKALGETGVPAAAAAALGVNNSTITRRLSQVEESLGTPLFDRRRTGYVATAAGAEIVALAERVELDVVAVATRVSNHAQGHAGDLRITTSDALLLHVFTPVIAEFQALNPAVRVEVSVGNHTLNLARGESDVAIRATETPPENLVGRKVAKIAWAPYGRRSDFVKGRSDGKGIYDQRWASYSGGLSALKASHFLERHVASERIVYRSDSVAGMAAAVQAGIGAAFLPCMLGDLCPDLVRIGAIEPELNDELWLLTHPDIRKSGRVFAFMRHCAEAIARRRSVIEGTPNIELNDQGSTGPSSLKRGLQDRLEGDLDQLLWEG
jgi:DNA-binding transcriptional LysR family regulator